MIEPGRVLVVDDVPTEAAAMVRVLAAEGHEVAFASSGAEALSALDRIAVDVVVLDYAMPEMDGAEVVEHLRKRETAPPVVVISGFSLAEARRACAGYPELVVAYLQKGASAPVIREAVWRALRLRRSGERTLAAWDDLDRVVDDVHRSGDLARAVSALR